MSRHVTNLEHWRAEHPGRPRRPAGYRGQGRFCSAVVINNPFSPADPHVHVGAAAVPPEALPSYLTNEAIDQRDGRCGPAIALIWIEDSDEAAVLVSPRDAQRLYGELGRALQTIMRLEGDDHG